MPNGMDQFLWFVAGVFSYRIISSILNYGHMYSFMKSLKGDIITVYSRYFETAPCSNKYYAEY